MPENMSQERIKILKLYGAKIILTPNKTEKARLQKDLSSHKERYSSVFEIAPKLKKAHKEQII